MSYNYDNYNTEKTVDEVQARSPKLLFELPIFFSYNLAIIILDFFWVYVNHKQETRIFFTLLILTDFLPSSTKQSHLILFPCSSQKSLNYYYYGKKLNDTEFCNRELYKFIRQCNFKFL